MFCKRSILTILCLILAGFPGAAGAQYLRDGRIFDPGLTMSFRAVGAPEELDLMKFALSDAYFKFRQALGLALRGQG